MGNGLKRGVGSNQYADKLGNVDQVNEVMDLRRLQEKIGNGAPVSTANDFRNFQTLESAHINALRGLAKGPFDKDRVESNARFISENQDRILESNPNVYGLAMLKAAKLEAVSKVSGEPHALSSETGTLYAQMQGELVEDEELESSLRSLAQSDGEVEDLPIFLAISSSPGDLKKKVNLLDGLRRSMSEEMSKTILGA